MVNVPPGMLAIGASVPGEASEIPEAPTTTSPTSAMAAAEVVCMIRLVRP